MKSNHEKEITIKIGRDTYATVKELAYKQTRTIKAIVDLAVKLYMKERSHA